MFVETSNMPMADPNPGRQPAVGETGSRLTRSDVGGKIARTLESPMKNQAVGTLPFEQLEALVISRLGGRVRDLRVVIREDGLILQGRAPTYHAKQLAQHAAMEAGQLPVLANDIEVC
jgi:hypothetical protein